MGETDILPTKIDNIMGSNTAIEDTAREQPLEFGIENGTSSKDRKRERVQRVANQCTAETTSTHTCWE